MKDPKKEPDGWDDGWVNSIEEGEGLEQHLLQAGDPKDSEDEERRFDDPS